MAAARPRISATLDDAADCDQLRRTIEAIAHEIGESTAAWLEAKVGAALRDDDLELIGVGNTVPNPANARGNDLAMRLAKEGLGVMKHVGSHEISALLHLGRNLKFPPLKGRWSKTLDKWAGKAAPVLQVLVSLAEAGFAAHEEEKRNRAARAEAMQRHQWVEEIIAELQGSIQSAAFEWIQATAAPALDALEAKRAELVAHAQRSAQELDAVERFASTFDRLSFVAGNTEDAEAIAGVAA